MERDREEDAEQSVETEEAASAASAAAAVAAVVPSSSYGAADAATDICEIVPGHKECILFRDRGPAQPEVLCKPKLLPIKSSSLKKLEKMMDASAAAAETAAS